VEHVPELEVIHTNVSFPFEQTIFQETFKHFFQDLFGAIPVQATPIDAILDRSSRRLALNECATDGNGIRKDGRYAANHVVLVRHL